jgi:hypothetical protein
LSITVNNCCYSSLDLLIQKLAACGKLQSMYISYSVLPGGRNCSRVSREALEVLVQGPAGQSLRSVRLELRDPYCVGVDDAVWLCRGWPL